MDGFAVTGKGMSGVVGDEAEEDVVDMLGSQRP